MASGLGYLYWKLMLIPRIWDAWPVAQRIHRHPSLLRRLRLPVRLLRRRTATKTHRQPRYLRAKCMYDTAESQTKATFLGCGSSGNWGLSRAAAVHRRTRWENMDSIGSDCCILLDTTCPPETKSSEGMKNQVRSPIQRWPNRDPLGEKGFTTLMKHKGFRKAHQRGQRGQTIALIPTKCRGFFSKAFRRGNRPALSSW